MLLNIKKSKELVKYQVVKMKKTHKPVSNSHHDFLWQVSL